MKTIYCIKLHKQALKLGKAPYTGELGQKILENVSQEGWQLWLQYQTMLINEKQLNLLDETTQVYLKQQAENFFFNEQSLESIDGYQPKSE